MKYEFGEYLRREREKKGLTLRALENLSGISYSRLSKIERGDSEAKPETIHKIAEALSLDYEDTLYRAGYVVHPNIRQFEEVEAIVEQANKEGLGRSLVQARLYKGLLPSLIEISEEVIRVKVYEDLRYMKDHTQILTHAEFLSLHKIEEALRQLKSSTDELMYLRDSEN